MEQRNWIREALYICRGHIILIAMAAQVVFGWLMSGQYLWAITLFVAVDWFFINLLNRVTDVAEDMRNNIPGTELVARNVGLLVVLCVSLLAGSFVLSHQHWPALTKWRLVVLAIGLVYNFKLLPWPGGRTRLKELYFFKNFGSAVIFIFTCFVYPRAALAGDYFMAEQTFWLLVGFFVCFEITYEIVYDLRDIEGDKEEGVPTYPVVHGATVALGINNVLLALSALILGAGFLLGWIGVLELLFVMAPAIQFVLLRKWGASISKPNCIWLTHLGTGLLLFYLAGTYVWMRAGLPANLYVPW